MVKGKDVGWLIGMAALGGLWGCGAGQAATSTQSETPNQSVTASTPSPSGASQLAEFTELENISSVDVDYEAGSAPSVKFDGDPADIKKITVKQQGAKLLVVPVGNANFHGEVHVHLTSSSLKKASLGASGSLMLKNLKGPLAVSLSGSGQIVCQGEADQLSLSLVGSGSIDAQSLKTNMVSADLAGSGRISLGSCTSLNANLTASGSLRVQKVNVLTGAIAGSGNVYYGGNPSSVTIDATASGRAVQE